jgi:cytochrome P450
MQKVRRVFANVLTARKCDTYLPIQQKEALLTISRIANDHENFVEEIHRYALSVARSIAFGKRVNSSTDPFAVQVKTLMEHFATAMTPGKYLFESIPSLRRLPRFMQPWLPELEHIRDYENEFSLQNYRDALADAEKYPDRPCIAREIRKEIAHTGDEVDDLQAATTCMEILGAGADTTATSLIFVILACLSHPDAVAKAHEELDRVIGQDRFPTWEDEAKLPYIRALIKEQHRWRTIAPMSALCPILSGCFRSDQTLLQALPTGATQRTP